jgi:hypothetical protein
MFSTTSKSNAFQNHKCTAKQKRTQSNKPCYCQGRRRRLLFYFNGMVGAAILCFLYTFHTLLALEAEQAIIGAQKSLAHIPALLSSSHSQTSSNNFRDATTIDATMLWVISSSSTAVEQQRRDLLRRTYLNYYNERSSQPNRICSWNDLDAGMVSSKECQLVYVFLMDADATTAASSSSSIDENAVIYLPSSYKDDPHSEAHHQLLFAAQLASKHALNYIARVDPTVVIHPTKLLEFLDQTLVSQSSLFYAAPKVPKPIPCTRNGNPCPLRPKDLDPNGVLKVMSTAFAFQFAVAGASASLPPPPVNVTLVELPQQTLQSSLELYEEEYHFLVHTPVPLPQTWNPMRDHYAYEQYQQRHRQWKLYNKFTRPNTRALFVTGRFGRNNPFQKQVSHFRNVLQWNGIVAEDIVAYHEFPDFILSDPKWQPHLEFMNDAEKSPRGAGYWFWKAPLIYHHLQQLRDGDVLVFADSDIVDRLEWTPYLIETMEARQVDIALYQQNYQERNWTKHDAYQYMCPDLQDPEEDTSRQFAGGFQVVRKTLTSIKFYEEWIEALSRYDLVNDEPSTSPDHLGFREHRHDQSLLGLLLKCRYPLAKKQEITKTSNRKKDATFWELYTFQLDSSKL